MASASEQSDSYCWNLFIGSSVNSHQKSDFWRLAAADSGEEIANSEYQSVGVNISWMNWDRNQLVTQQSHTQNKNKKPHYYFRKQQNVSLGRSKLSKMRSIEIRCSNVKIAIFIMLWISPLSKLCD
jgi:hypothetical protein